MAIMKERQHNFLFEIECTVYVQSCTKLVSRFWYHHVVWFILVQNHPFLFGPVENDIIACLCLKFDLWQKLLAYCHLWGNMLNYVIVCKVSVCEMCFNSCEIVNIFEFVLFWYPLCAISTSMQLCTVAVLKGSPGDLPQLNQGVWMFVRSFWVTFSSLVKNQWQLSQ